MTAAAGLALAGVLAVLGPASVAVLPVLFGLAALACWADGMSLVGDPIS